MLHRLDEEKDKRHEDAAYTAGLISKFIKFAESVEIKVPDEMRTATPEKIIDMSTSFANETIELARMEALLRIAEFANMHVGCYGSLKMRARKKKKAFTATICTSDSLTETIIDPEEYLAIIEVDSDK